MASEKSVFSSKIGVIAATVGSAVGLGNIWRFPAEAQANDGAAFLFVYILGVFILGIPVLLYMLLRPSEPEINGWGPLSNMLRTDTDAASAKI